MKSKVVLVRVPFDDLSSAKVRPAVCLTNPVGLYDHIVLAFITSQAVSDPLESDVELRGLTSTGLRVASTLRLHRMITVTQSIIRSELGKLPADIQKEVDGKLRRLFEP